MRNKHTYSRFIQNVLPWKKFQKGKMTQFLHHCVEHDITSFDCSDATGVGHVCHNFGTALSESGLSRDEIQLIGRFEGSKKILHNVEELLLTLDTDYLDLLLLDASLLTDRTKEDLLQLLSQGKIIELGGLNLKEKEIEDFELPIKVNQIQSPFHDRSTFSQLKTVIDTPETNPPMIWCWCDMKPKAPDEEVQVLQEMCEKYETSEKQLLLIWLLQHPAHLHLVISPSEKEMISTMVNCKEKQLEPIDWRKINLILS